MTKKFNPATLSKDLPPGPDQTVGKNPLNKEQKLNPRKKGGGRSSPVYVASRLRRPHTRGSPRPKTKDINK
jgi:hypothetical protein